MCVNQVKKTHDFCGSGHISLGLEQAAALAEIAVALNHERGNLLSALKAWVEAPSAGIGPAEALGHATKIVDRMLGMQRAEQFCISGLKNPGEVHVLSLDELLDQVLVLATPRLRARGVKLVVDRPDRPQAIRCNGGQTVAYLFVSLIRVAGEPRELARTLVLSADVVGEQVHVTAFLDATPEQSEKLVLTRQS